MSDRVLEHRGFLLNLTMGFIDIYKVYPKRKYMGNHQTRNSDYFDRGYQLLQPVYFHCYCLHRHKKVAIRLISHWVHSPQAKCDWLLVAGITSALVKISKIVSKLKGDAWMRFTWPDLLREYEERSVSFYIPGSRSTSPPKSYEPQGQM